MWFFCINTVFTEMPVNKKRKDVSVTETLCLTDICHRSNLRSLSQREATAKFGVLQSNQPSKLLKCCGMLNVNMIRENNKKEA
jgi:hypothetical protein